MNEVPSAEDPLAQEVIRLSAACLAGEATPEELSRLDQLLIENAEARQIYLSCMADAQTLRAWAAREAALQAGDSPEKAFSSAARPANHAPLSLAYWRAHPARFGVLALSLTLLFWAGVGWIVFSRFGGSGDDPSLDSTNVATITGLSGVNWAEGAQEYDLQDPLEAREVLHFTSGYVEITFEHGAVVLLEAPVEFTVDTRGAGTLEQGRLVARVDKQAERPEVVDFSISTPIALIIDLGTEFGVEVLADGTTSVEVLKGMVEATPRAAARPREARLVLTEGQFARLLPYQPRFEQQDNQMQLVQELPDEEDGTLHWQVASGNWGTASNWSGGAVPSNDDQVFIDNGTVTISGGANPATGNLLWLFLGWHGPNPGYLIQNGGVLNAASYWPGSIYGGKHTHSDGTLNVGQFYNGNGSSPGGTDQYGGVINANNTYIGNDGTNGNGFYNMFGGKLNISGDFKIASNTGTNVSAVFTQAGGAVNSAQTLTMGDTADTTGQAVYNLDGGTLRINHATPFAFAANPAPIYFDFDGGTLILQGEWDFTSLTAVANADFRFHGAALREGDLTFTTGSGALAGYTVISSSPVP